MISRRMTLRKVETTRTVRAYFLFFGSAAILARYGTMQEEHKMVWIFLVGIVLGILDVCAGLALPVLLGRHAELVKLLLVADLSCGAWITLFYGYFGEVRSSPLQVTTRLISGVFLTLYVMDNIDRLSAARTNGNQEAGNF
jgi:hypothetical protein